MCTGQGNKGTHLRFLVPEADAECLLRTPELLDYLERCSKTSIHWSDRNEHFPGTHERICMVSGPDDGVVGAAAQLIDALMNEEDKYKNSKIEVKLVLPSSSFDYLRDPKGGEIMIGKSIGKSLEIKIFENATKNEHNVGLHDRILHMIGTFPNQIKAVEEILSKLVDDPQYPPPLTSHLLCLDVSSHGYATATTRYTRPQRTGAAIDARKKHTIEIGIANEQIPSVIGPAGRTIRTLSEASGAIIEVSDEGDFIPGTHDRKVKITGTQEATRRAKDIIRKHANSPRW
ncbi:hypothetical protein ACP4OV_015397 [Aristida adscensionis]